MSTTNQLPLPATVASISGPPVLCDKQWEVLLSICDTIIPTVEKHGQSPSNSSLSEDAGADGESLAAQYYRERASAIPEFQELLNRLFHVVLNPTERAKFSQFLSTLSHPLGSVMLTRRTRPFSQQPLAIRQQILRGWAHSRFRMLRLFQRLMTMIVKNLWARTSPTLGPLLGFPRVPVDVKLGKRFEFNFIQIPPGPEPEEIDTDVVIVGSGCGGGVCAKVLAEAGLRVIVVEKGHYWPPEYLPMSEIQGPCQLYMNEGQLISDDGSTVFLAGSTWGGGGAVNWSACLELQPYVRQQWADTGLPFFTSAAFQESVDRVCATMGVSAEHIKHNKPNSKLMEGCQKLGWKHAVVAQNTGGHEHSCGHCQLGCRSAEKQGPSVAWLPKAANAGARFIEGFRVDKVEFEDIEGHKVAKGVRGVWKSRDEHGGVGENSTTTREVVIKAKRVIVSCGSLQSPLLLRRSGLTNAHIGQNLYVHPVSLVGGIYDEEIRPWEGSILTSVCTEFENLDGEGHGVKMETACALPYMWLTWSPWEDSEQFKELAAKLDRTAGFLVLHRNKDTGCVYPDPEDGRCRVRYSPSTSDKKMIVEGLNRLARLCYATGALEIFTTVPGLPPFVRTSDDFGTEFEKWIDQMVSHGFPEPQSFIGSAHQMGTCRMSASPENGVVGPEGHVWGTQGLYVADASVFPTASGVNPSLTVYAVADHIGRSIAAEWKKAAKGNTA